MKGERVWWQRLEWGLLIVGLILIGSYVAVRVYSRISSHLAVQKFEAARMEARSRAQESAKQRTGMEVDFGLWSDKRIQGYMESLAAKNGTPSAVLGIPKLNLEVPVYDGTDDLTLNRGVGRIIGTARLGEAGNTGIAGHRDGFFRGLKDIAPGDRIDLALPNQTSHYVVESIQITSPDDVSVLRPKAEASLTLVTCYPFYFVGSAPQRYIVSASFTSSQRSEPAPAANLAVPNLTQRRE
jgi:sortase A